MGTRWQLLESGPITCYSKSFLYLVSSFRKCRNNIKLYQSRYEQQIVTGGLIRRLTGGGVY